MRVGDNPSWSLPGFDDSRWAAVDPNKPLPDSLIALIREMERAGNPAIAWFRVRVTPERLLIRRPLALAFSSLGAADVFLDGRNIVAGDVEAMGTDARVAFRMLPTPILFDSASAVLSVRINLGSALAHAYMYEGGIFKAAVKDGAAIGHESDALRLLAAVMTALWGVFIAVGILHFVLYLLLRDPVSNLHYAAFAALFAVYPIMEYARLVTGSLDRWYVFGEVADMAMTFSLLALLTFLYTSFRERIPRFYPHVVALFIIFLFASSGLFHVWRAPSFIFPALLAAYAVEVFRVLVTALLQRKNGAKLIALGVAFPLLFFVSVVLNGFHLSPAFMRTWNFGAFSWLAWLGIAFAPSIHIAYEFAGTTKRFKALSGQLEQQVAVRTAELNEARVAAESANSTKSQFLANMSHELRTPLNAVIGYSEMLMDEADDAGHQGYVPDLKKIHGSGRHLLGLINDILDLSKIEAGRTEMFYETFDLTSTIEDVADTVAPLISRNGNTLSVEIDPNAGMVRLDQVKIRQILLNLLSNASKFTQQGRVAVHVTRADDAIAITVKDTGIGMTPEQLARVFEPFTQADVSTSKKYGGTGLGLTISQKFCEAMGGRIDLDSIYGEGTTFTVHLPADADAHSMDLVASGGGSGAGGAFVA
jgi:signal transduction histidine kinase